MLRLANRTPLPETKGKERVERDLLELLDEETLLKKRGHNLWKNIYSLFARVLSRSLLLPFR